MSSEDLITVRSYDGEIEAGHDQVLLESEGIAVVPFGLTFRKHGPIELRVKASDARRASEILGSIGRNDQKTVTQGKAHEWQRRYLLFSLP